MHFFPNSQPTYQLDIITNTVKALFIEKIKAITVGASNLLLQQNVSLSSSAICLSLPLHQDYLPSLLPSAM